MKNHGWKLLLAASLLVNAGVLAAVWRAGLPTDRAGEQAFFGMGHGQVAEHLKLDAAQRERWKTMEAGFIGELNQSARRIEGHRERLVRAILLEQPDIATIERERAEIFALQEAQQRAVIAQLLKERELLRPEQRAALAELLLAQRTRVPTAH
jgi:Spy/CpxP family protein refolding chaperone